MPVLLRAAHVDEVPVGTARTLKLRGAKVLLAHLEGPGHLGGGWYAFDAAKAKLPARPTADDVTRATAAGAAFRVVVRGTFVHVAMDSDREAAPASIQSNERQVAEVRA